MRNNPHELYCQSLRFPQRVRALPQGVRLRQGARARLDAFAKELRRAFGSRSSSSEVARGLCMLVWKLSHGAGGPYPGVHAGMADAAMRPTDPEAQHPAHGLPLVHAAHGLHLVHPAYGLHLVHPAHGWHAAHAACLYRVLRAVHSTRRTHGAEERK